jgi:hypothetical protein
MLTRRGLIRGMGALLAAPAIVRASNLMAVNPVWTNSQLVRWRPGRFRDGWVTFDGKGAYSVPLVGDDWYPGDVLAAMTADRFAHASLDMLHQPLVGVFLGWDVAATVPLAAAGKP